VKRVLFLLLDTGPDKGNTAWGGRTREIWARTWLQHRDCLIWFLNALAFSRYKASCALSSVLMTISTSSCMQSLWA